MSTQALTASGSAKPQLVAINILKGLACAVIVGHHLAAYSPMADVVKATSPALIAWLYNEGRMAVQAFLVIAGFLSADSLLRQLRAEATDPSPSPAFAGLVLIWGRYLRLAPAYAVALAITVAVSAAVRPWLDGATVPAAPTVWQALAHVLLLQDLLGYPALSAGVWYIAIDFQLYALAVLLFYLARRFHDAGMAAWLLVVALVATSLFFFNRHALLDNTALYFFGAYGLGMLGYWASAAQRPGRVLGVMLVLLAAALMVEFRERIALAGAVAFIVIGLKWWSQRTDSLEDRLVSTLGWLASLGRVSYSVFLIHFAVCLLVSAVMVRYTLSGLLMNAVALVVAFALSLLAGAALHRWVESAALTRAANWAARKRRGAHSAREI